MIFNLRIFKKLTKFGVPSPEFMRRVLFVLFTLTVSSLIGQSVTSVNSSTPNGTYIIGEVISIQVNFSGAVQVTGSPQLTMSTGAVVDYTSGSGSSALTFEYTIGVGESSNDLDYASTTALGPTGSIKDNATGLLNATLTLPTPGALNSLSSNKNLVVDGVLPTFQNAHFFDTNGDGNIDEVVIEMSEPVDHTTAEAADFTLTGGSISGVESSGAASNSLDGSDADQYVTLTASLTGTGTANIDYSKTGGATLQLADLAGNEADNDATIAEVDAADPVVLNVTSADANGTYIFGQTISIDVSFSESVTAAGTPQLTLETGSSDAIVNLSSGSGSSTLTFDYTVGSGQSSSDLNYQSTGALSAGTSIRDAALNDANLTLPALGGAGSLATNKDFVIDGVLPSVTNVTSSTSNGLYMVGEVISIQVVFNDVVTVTGTPTLTLETGSSDAVVNYTTGTGTNTLTFDYTIALGHENNDLSYVGTGSLTAGTSIQDANGNNATLTLPTPGAAGSLSANKNIDVDGVLPTFQNAHFFDTNGDGNIDEVVIEMSEPVNHTTAEAADFTLTGGSISGVESSGAASNSLDGSDADQYVTLTASLTGTGTANIDYSKTGGATLQLADLAGNEADNDATITEVDAADPVVLNVTSADANGTYIFGQTISIDVSFSESVTAAGTPQLTLETGSPDAVVNLSSGSGSSTLTFDYTVGSGQSSSDLNYQSTGALSAGTSIRDAALNDANLTLPALGGAGSLATNKNFVIDGVLPSVTNVTSSTSNGLYMVGEVISIQVVFNDVVTVTGTPTLTLETGSSDAVVNYASGTGTNTLTFNYTIALGHENNDLSYVGTGSLTAGTSIQDANGNNATLTLPTPGDAGSLSANKNIDVDGVLPTFQNAHFFDTNGDGNIDEVVIEMSEPVDHTTAEAADFTLTGGSISGVESSGAASNSLDGSDADQYVTLTASLTGTGTANIDYSKTGGATLQLVDLAGNEADNDATITEVDAAAPVIIQAVTADNDNNGYLDRITLTFSENIDDGNSGSFTSTTVDVAGYTGEAKVSGNDHNDEVIISFFEGGTPDTDATPSITLLSGQVEDADMNAIVSNQVFSSTEDGAAPVIVSATTVDDDLNGQIDGIEIVMSEPVDDSGSTLDGSTFDLAAPYDNNSPTATTGDTGNDELLLITFNEEGSADTDATPDVTLNSNKVQDQSAANNEVGINVIFGSTADGAIPVLLLATTSPAANASGVSINAARTFTFDFSENIDAIAANNISIYNTDDLVSPIYSADVTDAEVDVTGSTITWSHNQLLDKGESFAVGIDAGAFEDQSPGNLPSDELLNTGDNKWEWSMDNTGGPRYVYSPQHNTTTVAPYGLIYFYYDEPVRLQNSSNRRLKMDEITGFGGGDVGGGNDVINEEIDYNGNPVVSFILPYPSNTTNYTKEKIFDISETSYNGGAYKSGSFYEITVDADAFEDTGDNDSDGFEIEFQIDGSDPDRPLVNSFIPADDPSKPATIDVDIETTTSLTINFNENMAVGFGNIRMYADLSTDVKVLDIPSSSSLVNITGSQVVIDISGITLAGGVEYYVQVDRSAFTDLAGNTFAGFSDLTTWNFKMEPEFNAPEIDILSPADNATGVDVDSDLVITFNEPVQDQLAGGNLTVRLSSNGYIVETVPSSAFMFNGTEVTVPISTLGGLSGYYVNIDNLAIEDLGGNAFPGISGSFAWSFTTGSDTDAPVAQTSTFSPAHTSTGAAVGTNISFYFDEVVSPIAGNDITIYIDDGGPTVFETFDVTDPEILVSGNQVVINPSTDLDFVEDYYVVIDAGAFEDASGNTSAAIGGDGVWNFQTGVDTSNPYVVSTIPTNAASGISSGTITININETVTATPGKKIALYDATVDTLIQEIDGGDAEVIVATNVATIDFSSGFTTNGLTYYVAMDKGFFRDQNSNDIEDINPGEWTFSAQDNTPPTVIITRNAVTNGSFNSTNDAAISFDLAFSEPINDASFDDTDITVSAGGTASLGTVNLVNDADDRYYTFSIPVNSGDGDVSISVNAGSLTDQNGQVFVGPTSSSIIHVDQVIPTVALTLASNNASPSTLATTGNVVTLTMDFDDDLSGPPTVTMTSGGDVLNNSLTIMETSGAPNFIWTASYTVSALDSDGAIEFDVSFEDDGTNTGVSVDETNVFNTLVVDKVEPTILSQSATIIGSDVTLTTSLNEPGTVYYMFSSTPYTVPATLRADAIGAGNTINIPSASTNYQVVESLANNTTTTVYLVGEDIHGNLTVAVSSSAIQTGGVTISNPSLSNLCNSSLTDYTLLGDITIDETINNDFRIGSGVTFRIKLPTGFEFNTAVGTASATGADITVQPVLSYPATNELRITYTVAATASDDQITISDLEVKATDSPLTSVTLSRSGGSAVVYGAEESDSPVFGTLSSINPPATPTITNTAVVGNELVVNTGDDPSIQTTTTGGTINWYNYNYSSSQSGNPILLSAMPAPGGGTGFQANDGLYTLYFTEEVAGCESEPDKFNVLVRGYFQDPAGNSFVDDAGDIYMAISKPANHTVSFTGTGLFEPTTTADSSKVKFSPSTAGTGDHDILITTNNNNTGESLGYTETFSVSTTAQIFAVPLDVDYCQDGGVLSVNPRLDDIPGGYSFYGMYLDGSLISPPPGWNPTRDDNPTTGWVLDLSTVSPGQHKIQRRICRSPASIFFPPQTTNIVYLQADLDVYRVPSVSFSNLPEYICEDDLSLELDADIVNINLNGSIKALNTVDVGSYTLKKVTGAGTEGGPYSTIIGSDQFDPADPMGDGRDPVGEYEVTYTSSTADDPNFPTANDGKGCNDVDVRTIYVQAVPDLPELTTDLTGIGGEDGNRINLQFCVGDVIPDLVISADPDEEITWYTSNFLNTTYNSIGTNGEILEVKELFGTNQPNSAFNVNIYVTKTDYIVSGFEGCESPPKIINIRVYEDPSVPVLDVTQDAATRINSSSYLFEYCDSYGTDNVTLSSTLPDLEAYYILYDEDTVLITDLQAGSFDFSNISFDDIPNTSKTIHISRVLNDSTYVDSGAEFTGCESNLIQVEFRIYETSPAPDTTLFATNRTDYYICSGEDLGTITSPGEQNTRYAWYEDDGSGIAPDYGARMTVAAFDDRFIVQNTLVNEFEDFSNENLTTSPITYTYWVTQFQDYNDETGYIGCESEPSKITITVFPDPGAPTFDDPGVTYMDWDIANAHLLEISYCEGNIGQSIPLNLNGNTDAVFNWYRSNATGTEIIGNSVHDHIASEPVTTSQLKITDAEEADGLIYFVVTQTNNSQPLGADFDGCETETDEMAFVIINTYEIPEMPQTIDSDYTYCEDDVVTNGIELTGEEGVTFNWYKADVDGNMESTPFHAGSTADATELGLLGETGTGRYLFWVTQTQNIGDGVATFEGCESAPRPITVYEVPPQMNDIRYSSDYITSSEGFCVDVLQGAVIINYSGVEDALFTWYDQSMNPIGDRTLSAETFINTGATTVGAYTFFVSQTLNNCESELLEVTFNIYDTPDAPEFNLASNGTLINPQYEFIYCRDQDVSGETLLISNGQTGNIYEWYFDENLLEPITQNINEDDQEIAFTKLGISGVDEDEQVKTPGTYLRYVRSQESTECYSPVTRFDLVVGEAPDVAFTWDGLMEGVPVQFTMINDNDAVAADEVNEVRLKIDDNILYNPVRVSPANDPYDDNDTYDHTFTPGQHQVELFMRTSEVCRDSVTRTVTILDVIEVPEDGLLETFDNTSHGWFAEYRTLDGKYDTLVNSWEIGEPSTSTLNGAFSGDNAWVTNLDGVYAPNEISWVYSPAFDITNLTIPIVSFYHQHWLFNNRDAVVFQYSTDNGASWFKLGDFSEIAGGIVETSGLNWYTHADIPTQPGTYNVNSVDFAQSYNPSSFGWSSTQQSVQREEDRVSEWLLSINKMDNADTVIFRFALSSSGGDEDEGFAFDDFRVYNSDKITLLESFYNATETGVVAAYQDLRDQVDDQSVGSVAWINYFTELDMTSSSGRDDINRSNSIDPSARVGYYGINEAPRSAIEGEVQKLEGIDTESELYIRGFTPSALGVAGLESKKFDITNFQLDTSAPSDILRVSATFTAVQDFPDAGNEFSIRFMVIEKEITGLSIGQFSENDTLRNVLRKILPSAGGIIKQGALSIGTAFNETVEWKINNVYDPTQLDVIAFIQNENATNGRREIFQAAVLGGDFSNKELILGVLDQLRNGDPFVIYPNPVDNQFKLEILNPVKDDMDWKMFDQTGKEVLTGQLPGGEMSMDIETRQLPSGVFLLQLTHGDIIYEPKRIVVIHE